MAGNQEMMARRQPDIEDYIDMARRYRSWIVAPMFAGLVIATVVAFVTPDSYVSYATMRIKAQTIPDRLIPSVVNGGMSDRLAEMKSEILSRQSLIDLIRKPSLDLYKTELTKMPIDDVVELIMRKKIGISPIGNRTAGVRRPGGGGDSSAFTISFQYTDRYKAQRVVQELVSMFTTQNVTQKRNEVNLTTSFLDDEMKQAKEKMDRLDLKITQFKVTHPGQLPEQLQTNYNKLGTLQTQIMNQNMLSSNLQQEKMMLETHLKTQRSRLQYEESRMQQTESTSGQAPQSVKNDNLMNLDRTIASLRSQLEGKKRQMGSNHPDIRHIEGMLASVEQQRAAALEQADPTPAASSPVVRVITNPEAARQAQDLKGEISITTAQIAAKEIRMEELQKSVDTYQRQIAAVQKTLDDAPASDQEYVALRRDYDLAKADYETASKRRETADTAKNLEEHQGGEQLEQLDPPNLPERATEPTRPLWAGIGLFGGLMVGLSLAFGKEVKDTSLKNLKDVRAYTNLPVLSSIPLLENALLIRRKRRLVWLAWSTTILVGGALMSGSVLYYLSQRGGS